MRLCNAGGANDIASDDNDKLTRSRDCDGGDTDNDDNDNDG